MMPPAMVAANAIQMSFRTLELISLLPAKCFQSIRPANGWNTANPSTHVSGSPISTGLLSWAAIHSVEALAARTKARAAPPTARIFQPPCHRGRLGRTYPGGAVVPFLMSRDIPTRRVHFNNMQRNVNSRGSVPAPCSRDLRAALNWPNQPLSDSPAARPIIRMRRATEPSALSSVSSSVSLPIAVA